MTKEVLTLAKLWRDGKKLDMKEQEVEYESGMSAVLGNRLKMPSEIYALCLALLSTHDHHIRHLQDYYLVLRRTRQHRNSARK